MSTPKEIGRRKFLLRAAGGLAALSLGGCDDSLSQNRARRGVLDSAEKLDARGECTRSPAREPRAGI